MRNSSALAVELRLSCTNPSIYMLCVAFENWILNTFQIVKSNIILFSVENTMWFYYTQNLEQYL